MLKLASGHNSYWPNGTTALILWMVVIFGCPLSSVSRASDLTRVRSELEIKGEIRLNPDGQGVQTRHLVAHGDVAYDQQLTGKGQAARYYLRAVGQATVGKSTTRSSLRSSHRIVHVGDTTSRLTFLSPAGPLTQDELDVLEVQFDPLILQKLIPSGSVVKGRTVKASRELLAALFFVDVVQQSDIVSKVIEVSNSSATIRIQGNASAAIDGVSTAIEVSGQLTANLDSQLIERTNLTIQEKRAIGHASPGFHLTATIRTAISPLAKSQYLTSSVLESLAKLPNAEQDTIVYSSKNAGVTLSHDEHWKVMLDRPETLILRLVDRGDLIGQCNVSRLTTLSDGRRLSLEQFKSSIRTALGDNFGQILESSRHTTKHGTVVLRVAIRGTASGVAVNWFYYHVSDESGQRVSLVFTSEAELADRFAGADRAVVASLRFNKPATSQHQDLGIDDEVKQANSRSEKPTRHE